MSQLCVLCKHQAVQHNPKCDVTTCICSRFMSPEGGRGEIITKMAEFFRAVPHRPKCPRQPPFEGNVFCDCDIGDKLGEARKILFAIILEVTEESS